MVSKIVTNQRLFILRNRVLVTYAAVHGVGPTVIVGGYIFPETR